MKKRGKSLFLCTLLITTILLFSNTVLAGDETDPEITDDELDLFGPWAKPGNQDNYAYLDIVSAWFTEDVDEPDYLMLYLKVKDLEFQTLLSIYSMHWKLNGITYATGVHTNTNGQYKIFIAGVSSNNNYYQINGEFDQENNIVFFKVPKLLVGYPEQGDIFTDTEGWAALRYRVEFLTLIHGDGELIKDFAGYGRDYIVQYDCVGVPFMHRIFGPEIILAGQEYTYNFRATDPQDEDVFYYIDWDDGFVADWVGPFSSDEPVQFKHTWSEPGHYTIRVKARDTNGYESDWVSLTTGMSRNRVLTNTFLHRVLERFPNAFPMLRCIIGL